MDKHVYDADEANAILDAFPANKLAELLELAEHAKQDPQVIESHERVILPDGWVYELCGNCILARYQDGEQERKEFYLPQIYIEFKYTDKIEAKKSVGKRLALGYCSCGKRMSVVQGLLWTNDMTEHTGILHVPSRMLGYSVAFFIGLYVWMRPIHQYSLMFNRHPDCL